MTRLVNKWSSKLKIKHKLFFSYFFFAFIPLLLAGIFSYNFAAASIQNETINIYTQMQNQRIEEVKHNINQYDLISHTIQNNQNVQQFTALHNYSVYNEYYDYVRHIQPFMDTLINSVGNTLLIGIIRYNEGIEVIPNNFENLISASLAPSNPISMSMGYFYIINRSSIEKQEWFQAASMGDCRDEWIRTSYDKINGNISIINGIYSFNYQSDISGMLRLTLPLDKILNEADQTSERFDLIFDTNGDLMSTQSWKQAYYKDNLTLLDTFRGSPETESKTVIKDRILVKNTVGDSGWTIVSIYEINAMNAKIYRARNLVIIYSLADVVLLLLVTSKLSTSFSNRLIKVVNMMKEFDKQDGDITVYDRQEDEIGYISQAFNHMKRQLDKLIHDIYQVNIEKKDAQLTALQAQINPHFLYNSLSIVSRLAENGQYQSIIHIVNALVVFYRMTLNKGEEIIRISDELLQIEAYIDIYKVRKGNQFKIHYRINEETAQYYTIKIILQPFIENIFDHAIFDAKRPVNIILSANVSERDIVFKIIDDGIGINRKRLAEINTKKVPANGRSSYGVQNVDDRIKLFFGDGYGVTLYSIYGAGTTAEIRIPKFTNP